MTRSWHPFFAPEADGSGTGGAKTETFELPVDEKGVPFIPDSLMQRFQPVVDRLVKPRLDKERQKIEQEFSQRRPVDDPVSREQLKKLQEDNERFQLADLERQKRYEEAEKLRVDREKQREADHKKELDTREKEIERRTGRLKQMASNEIKIAAKKFGARDESLDELAQILGGQIDLDTDLQPFVKGSDGKPLTDKDGQPVPIEGHVKSYLDSHPHHRAAAGGSGGGARGGASLSGAEAGEIEKLEQEIEDTRKAYRRDRTNSTLASKILTLNKQLDAAKRKAS